MVRFGLFNTEAHTIESACVDETYQIGVWLPFSYADSDQDYPVLYILDGDFAFGLATSLVPTLIGTQEIPELIVVGIGYQTITTYGELGQRRERDFLPPDFADAPPDSRTPQFTAFLQQELFPLIESHYRASPANRVLYGFSAAGFFALYTMLTQPGLFQRCIAASCTWPGAAAYLLERAQQSSSSPDQLYLAVGELEADQLPGFQALTEALHNCIDLHTQIFSGENHSAGVLSQTLLYGLRTIF